MLIKDAIAILNHCQGSPAKHLDMVQDLLSLDRAVSGADTLSMFYNKDSPIIAQCQSRLLIFIENLRLRTNSCLVQNDFEIHPYENDVVEFRDVIVMCRFHIETLPSMESS